MGYAEDIRCTCGKLVCRHQEQKIIIKCRHCKRFIVISLKTTLQPDKKEISVVSMVNTEQLCLL